MHKNNEQELLKAKINLLLKKVICLGCDYSPKPAQLGIYYQTTLLGYLFSLELPDLLQSLFFHPQLKTFQRKIPGAPSMGSSEALADMYELFKS